MYTPTLTRYLSLMLFSLIRKYDKFKLAWKSTYPTTAIAAVSESAARREPTAQAEKMNEYESTRSSNSLKREFQKHAVIYITFHKCMSSLR